MKDQEWFVSQWMMTVQSHGGHYKIVAVGLMDEQNPLLIPCPVGRLKLFCRTLATTIETFSSMGEGDRFYRLYTTPKAYIAAMGLLYMQSPTSFDLDADETIEFFNFVWKYDIDGVKEASKRLCLWLDFAQIEASCLIKLHFSFSKHNIWKENRSDEKKLLEAISLRGSEVICALLETKHPAYLDTVIKILKQRPLNVFSEGEVYIALAVWKNAVALNNVDIDFFYIRYSNKIFPLLQRDLFPLGEMNDVISEFMSKSGLNFSKEMNMLEEKMAAMWSCSEGNLANLLNWRGNFMPNTPRIIILTSKEGSLDHCRAKKDNKQTFALRPLKNDVYLLHVKLFNLKDLRSDDSKSVRLLVELIKAGDKAIVSKINFEWKPNDSYQCRLPNPCRLEKNQLYHIKVTNLADQNEFQNYFEVGSDDRSYKEEFWVGGKGNICAFRFAVAKNSNE